MVCDVDDLRVLLMEWTGERLKELRELRGWTQADLAELSSIDQSKISRWERGQYKPGVDDIFRLADALRVSCEAFRQPVGQPPLRSRKIGDNADDAVM